MQNNVLAKSDVSRRDFLAYSGKAAAAAALLSSPFVTLACGGETASGVLRLGTLEVIDTLNPVISVATRDLLWAVYDRLLEFDNNLTPQLALATDREVSADGTRITYTIRDGVKFHDGEPLTSADVKYSLDLINDTQLSSYAAFFVPLRSVEAPDDLTVVLNFSGPPTLDPAVGGVILPKHLWEGMSKEQIEQFQNDDMIGSGAFKLNQYIPDDRMDLDRNEDWWGWSTNDGPKTGTIAQMAIVKLANDETMANSLKQNEVDVTTVLTTDTWLGLRDDPNIDAVEYPALTIDHFGINVYEDPDNPGQPHPNSGGNPLLLDQVVREAMSWAIDRQRLVDLVLGGLGTKGSVVVPPALADFFLQVPEDQQANGNPDKAREILEAAGYIDRDGDGIRESPGGDKLSFRLFASTVLGRLPQYAELIKPMLEAVGMEIEGPIGEDDPTLISRVFVDADWDMYTWVWQSPPDPTFMLSVQTCDQFGNLSDTYYCDEAFEAAYAAQLTEPDVNTRAGLVKEAERVFYEDFAYIVMTYPAKLQAHRTDTITNWPFVTNGIVSNSTIEAYVSTMAVEA